MKTGALDDFALYCGRIVEQIKDMLEDAPRLARMRTMKVLSPDEWREIFARSASLGTGRARAWLEAAAPRELPPEHLRDALAPRRTLFERDAFAWLSELNLLRAPSLEDRERWGEWHAEARGDDRKPEPALSLSM